MDDLLRAVLEAVAVAAIAAGLGLVAAALVGGLLGAGTGVLTFGLLVLAAAEVSRLVHRPEESETTP